jgi:hypothetical protein
MSSMSRLSPAASMSMCTITYPVKDLAAAKRLYGLLFGVEPYIDEAYYAAFNLGGHDVGLDPLPGTRRRVRGRADRPARGHQTVRNLQREPSGTARPPGNADNGSPRRRAYPRPFLRGLHMGTGRVTGDASAA